MAKTWNNSLPATDEQRAVRRRYLGATLVTCMVASIVGGTIHVLDLGASRMTEMRDKAGYDLAKEHSKIRAAGEELYVQRKHEFSPETSADYSVAEARSLLDDASWAELGSFVEIPGGEFLMGTDRPRADEQDKPQRTETIDAFYLAKYPVTNAQYAVFVADTGHRPPLNWANGKIPIGREKHPVVMVSWFDAKKYAEWVGARLPSEKEWEKAARGGDDRRWPWGNDMDPKRLNTYYSVGSTTEVMAYKNGVSPYGVFDLAGNVNEWTADDFMPYEGSAAPSTLFQAKVPQIPSTGAERGMRLVEFADTEERYKVLRGGSWKGDPFSTSAYHRNFAWPHAASDFFGFRIAKDSL